MVIRWSLLVSGVVFIAVGLLHGWQAAALGTLGACGVMVGLFLDDGDV